MNPNEAFGDEDELQQEYHDKYYAKQEEQAEDWFYSEED